MDSSSTSSSSPSLRERIRSVLEQAHGPLHGGHIITRVEADGHGFIPVKDIDDELHRDSNKDVFQNDGDGIFRLCEVTVLNEMNAPSEATAVVPPKRIVKIAPGEGAKYWDQCREGGYICVGWDELGDLSRFKTKEEFLAYAEEKLKRSYSQKAKRSEKANEVWTLRELRPGDVVLANKGISEIVGIGDVVEPAYYWNADRTIFSHCVAIKWREVEKRTIPNQSYWRVKTIAPVSQQLYNGIVTDSLSSAEEGRHVWLFQANVNHYNLKEVIATKQVGDEDEWTVTRYKDEMRVGDLVLLWQSGPDAGIYAIAELTGTPYEREVNLEASPWLARMGNEASKAWWVPFKLTHILEEPLLRSLPPHAQDSKRPVLIGHPILKDLAVIRFPQGTNHKITAPEWKALKALLGWETLIAYWWVNQGSTYADGHDAGVLWAPQQTKDGRIISHWSNMAQLRAGDRVLHYANGEVRALGTVLEESVFAPRPGEYTDPAWKEEGYLVRVRYDELSRPVPRDDIPSELRTIGSNAADGGPFTRQGTIKQGYLFSASSELFETIQQLASGAVVVEEEYTEPAFEPIRTDIEKAGLRLDETTLRRYHLSLKTRGFVILSGQSGTGKTWLSQLYAQAVGANCKVVAVAPNWTTNEDLLGYYNPLNSTYQETEFGQFVRAAADEYARAEDAEQAPRPYHLVLDEMNLARVEYYFAKFLSALEIRARQDSVSIDLGHDQTLTLPPNLFFIGTVNVDETTHGFADKIYDRAQLIELSAPREELFAHIGEVLWREPVMEIWDAINEVAPFAFRVLEEIRLYVEAAQKMDVSWELALDEQILQKILPKFKGSDPRVEAALEFLVDHCEQRFPLSYRKATEILGRYRSSGFASFF